VKKAAAEIDSNERHDVFRVRRLEEVGLRFIHLMKSLQVRRHLHDASSRADHAEVDTLRQGLAIQREQSPYVSLVSDERIQGKLGLMGQLGDARLTPKLAEEICERTASAAVLEGSIASLGSQYVVGLRAKNCRHGGILDAEQVQAARKEDVLNICISAGGSKRMRQTSREE
jgi:hypothetical protein